MFKVGDIVKQSGIRWYYSSGDTGNVPPYPNLKGVFRILDINPKDPDGYNIRTSYLNSNVHSKEDFCFNSIELVLAKGVSEIPEDSLWE